jgi:ferrous iron transport protein B
MKKKIALAGNPNVGKSTIFNTLTGMHQHTGNWPGKTVGVASGTYTYKKEEYELIDLPGTYSLISHSEEETVTRNYLCFHDYDMVLVVCDGLCLEKS